MFGYINVNGAQLSEGIKSKRSEEIQGILLWTLPEIKRVLWKKRTGTFEL